MNPPGSRLTSGGRFRARSPAELGDRALQRMHTWLELFAGASRGVEPSDDALERALHTGHRGHSRPETDALGRTGEFTAFLPEPDVGAQARERFPEASLR